jgi:hypothetical protein
MIVQRGLKNALILYAPNQAATGWVYSIALQTLGNGGAVTYSPGDWLTMVYCSYSSGFNPWLSSQWFPEVNSDGNTCVFLDVPVAAAGGFVATVLNFQGLPSEAGAYVITLVLTREYGIALYDTVITLAVPATTTTASYTMPFGTVNASTYTAIQFASTTSVLQNIAFGNIIVSGTSQVHAHSPVPQWLNYRTSVQNASLNAASLMYTNVAAKDYREGKIVQVQLPAGYPWTTAIGYGATAAAGGTATNWSNLGNIAGACVREAVEGAFSFLKPDGPQSYQRAIMYDQVDDLHLQPPFDSTIPSAGYLLLYVSTTAGASARDGYWSAVCSAEYETIDQTRERRLPETPVLDFLAAHDVLPRLEQHHPNSTHIKELLGQAMGAIVDPVGTGTKAIGSLLNAFLG